MLFYTPEYREKRIVEPRSQLGGELRITAPRSDGWLDRMLSSAPAPIPNAMAVPNFLPGALLAGDVARVKVSWPGSGAPLAIIPPVPQPVVKGALPDWGGPLQKRDEAK
jgi:hypothetical protein